MSIWYHYDVEVMGKRESIAKFLNLQLEDVRIEHLKFSFGQKNGPGLRLGELVVQNPDLIFLVKESVEVDSVAWWIERFDKDSGKIRRIHLEDSGEYVVEINKKVLDAYTKEYPTLPAKHLAREKGFEDFRWSMFFDFETAAVMLNQSEEYKEMVSPMEDGELQELGLV